MRESKNLVERFCNGITSKILLKVEVSERRKTFFYIVEDGKRRRIAATDYICPECVEPRNETQITYSPSVHGDNRSYCRLCGAEVCITMMIDGPVTPMFGALSDHITMHLNGRIRADMIRFFNGAKVFQPLRIIQSNEESA
jgi:hypothetical protein